MERKKEVSKEEYILHYTCNPPEEKILYEYGIIPVGAEYGLSPRELLKIPVKLFEKMGYLVENNEIKNGISLELYCENLLVRIEMAEKTKQINSSFQSTGPLENSSL